MQSAQGKAAVPVSVPVQFVENTNTEPVKDISVELETTRNLIKTEFKALKTFVETNFLSLTS